MKIIPLQSQGFDCNVFLLKDPKSNRFDLVDAGIGSNHALLLKQITEICDPHRIDTVAVTHEHLDHVNGLPAWQALGARVAASRPCAEKLRVGHDPTSARFGNNIPQLDADVLLEDEGDLSLGGQPFKALWTPGHSPGSMCYWQAEQGVLFSGDVVFEQGGIGRFDFPDGDLQRHAESILRLEKLPVKLLHCGHGASVEGDAASRSLQGSVSHVQACVAQGL